MNALLESLERGSNDWALAQSLGPQRLPARIAMGSGAIFERRYYEDEFKAIKDIEIRTYDERVYVFAGGQAACATSLLDADMKLARSGKRVFFRRVRVSWVLEKVCGAWRAVHAHYSLPVGEPLSKME